MKTLKTRYDYLLLVYIPLTVTAFLSAYFFPQLILCFIQALFIGILVIVCIALPYAKQLLSTVCYAPTPIRQQRVSSVIYLQLGLSWLFLNFLIFHYQFTTPKPVTMDIFNWHYWQWTVLIWPLYLLLGMGCNQFLNTHYAFLPIKQAVKPVSQRLVHGVLAAGAEFYLRQCWVFISAYTLITLSLQIVLVIQQSLQIPLARGFTLINSIFSWLVLITLNTLLWRRLLRLAWQKKLSLGVLCLLFIILVVTLISFYNGMLYLVKKHWDLAIFFQNPFTITGNSCSANALSLFSLAWWLSWAPLGGLTIAHFAQQKTVRRTAMMVLPVPCMIGITMYALQASASAQLVIIHMLSNPLISLALAASNLLLIYWGLTHCKVITDLLLKQPARKKIIADPSLRYSLNRLTRLFSMAVFIWLIFWMAGKNLISWIHIGIALPNLVALLAIVIGSLYSWVKRSPPWC